MSFYVCVLINEEHSVARGYSTACESRAIFIPHYIKYDFFHVLNSAVRENRTIYFVNSLTMCVVTDEFKRTKLFT